MQKRKFEYTERFQYPTTVMLNVTDACNLACKYCFVEQHPHYMTLDIAKKAVDWIIFNYNKKREKQFIDAENKCILNFFGGEPLLMYEQIIKPLILYIEEKYPNLFEIGITTNCTLLDKEKIDFLSEHLTGILCSIDGAEETQCYNRPCRNGDNSSKLIEKNISYLLEKFPNTIFRSTGYAPTIHNLFENYKYAESLGFKRYAMVLDERHKWSKKQKNELKDQMEKIFYYILQQILQYGQPKMYTTYFDPCRNLPMFFQSNSKDDCLRCGLGTISCSIGYDGQIYGCQQNVSQDKKNIFLIGNLETGINIKKHKKLIKKYFNSMHKFSYLKCKNCKIKYGCHSEEHTCPSANYELSHKLSLHKISKINCYYFQLLYKLTLINECILIKLQEGEKDNGL